MSEVLDNFCSIFCTLFTLLFLFHNTATDIPVCDYSRLSCRNVGFLSACFNDIANIIYK